MPDLTFRTGDPSEDLVEDLLSRLETAQPTPPPKVGVGRRILGSLGDAITAAAAVRAGGQPPQIGSFRATIESRERAFEAQQAAAEANARALRNRVRIGDWEARRNARLEAQTPADVDTTEETLRGTERLVAEGVIPDYAKDQQVRIRFAVDPTTGRTVSREFLGLAKVDTPNTKTFPAMITAEDVKTNPELKEELGERWMFLAIQDPATGVFDQVKPIRPVGDAMSFIETPTGYIGVGRQSGQVQPVIDPDTQKRAVSHRAYLLEIELRNKERVRMLGKDLEAGTQGKIALASTGVEAAAYALRRYRELGGPQLIVGNQWVTSEEAKQARAAIARSALPIRKWLFGAALTATEKASAGDIIPDLEQATNPAKLEANLVEIANLMWTSRRSILDTAGKAGRNVSNFEPEMRRMIFRNSEELLFEAPSILGEGDLPTDDEGTVRLQDGSEVVVDESGNIKIRRR